MNLKFYDQRVINELQRKQSLMYPRKGYNNVMWEKPGVDYIPDKVFKGAKKLNNTKIYHLSINNFLI